MAHTSERIEEVVNLVIKGALSPQDAAKIMSIKIGTDTYGLLAQMAPNGISKESAIQPMHETQLKYDEEYGHES